MSTISIRTRCLIPAVMALAMVLVPPLLLGMTSPVAAQSRPATGTSVTPAGPSSAATSTVSTAAPKVTLPRKKGAPPTAPADLEAEKYASEGWSVVGPVKISSANANQIHYQTAKQEQTVNATGKKLTVINPEVGVTSTVGNLQPDTWVYICQLRQDIVVILSNHIQKMREQRNDR